MNVAMLYSSFMKEVWFYWSGNKIWGFEEEVWHCLFQAIVPLSLWSSFTFTKTPLNLLEFSRTNRKPTSTTQQRNIPLHSRREYQLSIKDAFRLLIIPQSRWKSMTWYEAFHLHLDLESDGKIYQISPSLQIVSLHRLISI